MKNFIRIILIGLCCQLSMTGLLAQAPHAIPYQAVARNAGGNLISNQNISLRFTIHNLLPTGNVVYQETQSTTTNAFGLFSVHVGTGTGSTAFSTIQWGSGAKFMQVEIDTTGGTSYTDMGTQQLMSVPYAEYANNGLPAGTAPGSMLYWDGTQWLSVAPGTNGQTLCFCNGKPQWGPCLPIVTTSKTTGIDYTYATAGGNVTNDGGSPVSSRGVCWNTSPNPTLSDFTLTSGSGTGAFSGYISSLQSGTTYYVRAFATNAAGTAYGNEDTFTTSSAAIPTVYTQSPGNITYTTAISGITGSFSNGAAITGQGICWSTSPNPTPANSSYYGSPGYLITIHGLNPGTTYYVRAFATNDIGTGYGNEYSFTTKAFSLPSVTTTAMSSITTTSATTGGTVAPDPYYDAPYVSARGICYSTSPNPTTADQVVDGGDGTGSFSSDITGLAPNTTYYVRAFATNEAGTGYGNEITFTSSPYTLGQSLGGGVIFYIDGATGQHGLIAATADGPNSGNMYWYRAGPYLYNPTPFITGATDYGTGSANTTAIINAIGTSTIAGNCRAYNGGGFTDWFLPSKDELVLMMQNKSYIGNLNNGNYWSSSQTNGVYVNVWACDENGNPFQSVETDHNEYYYRPVRSF